MNLDLSGKNALVCGSTQGIGKAIAVELALLGANIILVARNEQKLATVKSELDTSKGQNHNYIIADFSTPPQLKLHLENYIEINEVDVNILINNTGGPAGGTTLLQAAGTASWSRRSSKTSLVLAIAPVPTRAAATRVALNSAFRCLVVTMVWSTMSPATAARMLSSSSKSMAAIS